MTQDAGAPALRLTLGAAVVTAPGSGDPVTAPLPTLPGHAIVTGNPEAVTGSPDVAGDAAPVTMAWPERVRLALACWAGAAAGTAGKIWAPSGRALHSLWHPVPETMAEHRAYIRSREWVPPGLAGKPAAAIAWAGIVYHVLIGHPMKASMKAAVKVAENIDQAAERPLRLSMFAVFISALVLILLNL